LGSSGKKLILDKFYRNPGWLWIVVNSFAKVMTWQGYRSGLNFTIILSWL
jgi:hypothetical protein